MTDIFGAFIKDSQTNHSKSDSIHRRIANSLSKTDLLIQQHGDHCVAVWNQRQARDLIYYDGTVIRVSTHSLSVQENHPWRITIEHHLVKGTINFRLDSHALRPFYYCHTGPDLYYSTSFRILASVIGALSWNLMGVISLLSVGCMTHNLTLAKEIKRFTDGQCHFFGDGTLTTIGINNDSLDLDQDTDIAETAATFIQTISKRLKGKRNIWIPLSGGIDSRTILSAIPPELKPHTYTRGHLRCSENTIAHAVSALLHCSHQTFPFPEDYLKRYARKIIAITGAMIPIIHGHAIYPLEELVVMNADVIIPGVGGEYGRCFWPFPPTHAGLQTRNAIAVALFDRQNVNRGKDYHHLFRAPARPLLKDLQESMIQAYITASSNAQFCHPIAWNDEYYLNERVRNFTIMGALIWDQFIDIELPFLEPGYIRKVRSLLPLHRNSPLIHSHIIKQQSEALLKIPLYPSFTRLSKSILDKLHARLLKNIQHLFYNPVTITPQPYAQWFRMEADFINSIIYEKNIMLEEIVDMNYIHKLWEKHIKGEDHHKIIGRILTIKLFHEIFMSEPT